jgi:diguanylate cyclase (GGDEF)-like protein
LTGALDTRTLVAVIVAVAGVLLIAQILLWRIHRSVPGTGHWALMTSFFCLGFALLSQRDALPHLLTIVAANLFVVGATLSGLRGVRRFRGIARTRRERWAEAGLFLAVAVGQAWLTYVTPSFRGRVLLMSTASATVLAATAWTLVRGAPRKTRAVRYSTAATFGIVAVVLGLRTVHYAASSNIASGFMASSYWQSSTFLATIVAAIGWTVGLLLLGAQRVELELRDAKDVLQTLASTDDLTGIHNRRALLERMESEITRARRYQSPLSVILFDLDHFKTVNDTHGHATGDQVLRSAVERCLGELRQHDAFGRLGGEEFAVLAPETGLEGAVELAERLRRKLATTPIPTESGPLEVTASFGVAVLPPERASREDLLRSADLAVYTAKSGGRNCVEVAEDAVEPTAEPAPELPRH